MHLTSAILAPPSGLARAGTTRFQNRAVALDYTMQLNPRVKAVRAQPDYTLRLTFTNGEVRIFDVKPYLSKGIFRPLQNLEIFNSVRPFLGSVQWSNEADLCPDTLYEKSVPVTTRKTRPLQVAEARGRYDKKRR